MRRIAVGLTVVLFAGCGSPKPLPEPTPTAPSTTTLTAPPTVTESFEVTALMEGDPCDLVSRELLVELDIDSPGESWNSFEDTKICRWEKDGARSAGLGIGVETTDPLEDVYDREEATLTEIGGFPAMILALHPRVFCDISVKTAPTQGFSVARNSALYRELDACGDARKVAEHIAGRVRER